jgi:tRNA threonylcarbamoyladenosine biosynthesis protein TsaB
VTALALDASTAVLSCALAWEGGWASRSSSTGLTHAERLIPLVDGLLAEAGIGPSALDLVICACGPGSFTGLRIALSAAKGICAGSGAELVLAPTLDYLAMACGSAPTVVPMIDARKGRVYAAIYRSQKRDGPWLDLSVPDLTGMLSAEDEIVFTGPDAELMSETVAERAGWGIDPCYRHPRPECLLELGLRLRARDGAASLGAGPLYVRNDEADIGITRAGEARGH